MKPKCPKCGKPKDKTYIDKSRQTVRHGSYCQKCFSKYMKEYRKKKREQNIAGYRKNERQGNLKRYGLTIKAYEQMIAKQNGKCKICGGEPNGKGRLHVDHCHETGKIRGLLCHSCNTGIGLFKHNVVLLAKASKYLV
jgi:hypothetical protein